jgi:hypothetical protein
MIALILFAVLGVSLLTALGIVAGLVAVCGLVLSLLSIRQRKMKPGRDYDERGPY